MNLETKDRLIVALDLPDLASARRLAELLQPTVSCFKIGHQLFTAAGPEAVRMVKDLGARVFLDLKYHDIPNTVAQAVASAIHLGVDIINLHAWGGIPMMKAAAEAAQSRGGAGQKKVLILAVTVLTSIDQNTLNETLGLPASKIEDQVIHLARQARLAGLDGVVASPREIKLLRQHLGPDFVILTPGIRSSESPPDDQQRTAAPAEAVAWGADFIVVGRPITQSPDPVQAATKIIEEMEYAVR